jgi:hypothetical protein
MGDRRVQNFTMTRSVSGLAGVAAAQSAARADYMQVPQCQPLSERGRLPT